MSNMKYIFLDTGFNYPHYPQGKSFEDVLKDIVFEYSGKKDVTLILDTCGTEAMIFDYLESRNDINVIGCQRRRLYSRENQYESEKS